MDILTPASRTSDPAHPTQLHRLLTTLLDADQASAHQLIACSHERWEIELRIERREETVRAICTLYQDAPRLAQEGEQTVSTDELTGV